MKNFKLGIKLLIIIGFLGIMILDYSTPPAYIFGYLYIGPILLANYSSNYKNLKWIAAIAIILTLLNLFIPGEEALRLDSVVNRFLVVIALGITAVLSYQNRLYQEAITRQRIQLEAEKRLASVREDFASTLTHDLKTPLLGGIETLKAFEAEKFGFVSAAQRKVLGIMIRSHINTLQLVETVLDIYKNDTKGLQLNYENVDLLPLAEMAIASLTELAYSRSVYINMRSENSEFRTSFWVKGDAFQLQRVFVNLLTNGINHSLRGAKVDVIFTSAEGYHIVKVIDQGEGIRDVELPFLFERFYQGHSNRQAKGTGLGLYLCRQIIEAHGGKIWVEQGSPKGAIFAFSLLSQIV